MAEYQVEMGFKLNGRSRDVELLELFGDELELLAGENGPATAIRDDGYVAMLIVEADSPLAAGKRAWELVIDAMNRALRATGDELEVGDVDGSLSHLHVDEADAVLA